MVPLLIDYPRIDPVLFEIGPFAIRWYALAYIAGLILGWRYCIWLASKPPLALARELFDDFLVWAIVGVLVGGRLGYVLFYKPLFYLENPLQIPMIWEGGMSFHGGMIGVILALYFYTRARRVPFFPLMDVVAVAGPIGLFFGRLANFINGELYGRATDVSWAMIFPNDFDQLPRHPSQLYEAALEGIVLFLAMHIAARYTDARLKYGWLCGLFLIGYSIARILVEFVREPDAQLGYLAGIVTMGQLLCVPMILLGIYLMARAKPASSV
jgi:phosphatidylglycerol:prolipoprotein diacylglycerol transferase